MAVTTHSLSPLSSHGLCLLLVNISPFHKDTTSCLSGRWVSPRPGVSAYLLEVHLALPFKGLYISNGFLTTPPKPPTPPKATSVSEDGSRANGANAQSLQCKGSPFHFPLERGHKPHVSACVARLTVQIRTSPLLCLGQCSSHQTAPVFQ